MYCMKIVNNFIISTIIYYMQFFLLIFSVSSNIFNNDIFITYRQTIKIVFTDIIEFNSFVFFHINYGILYFPKKK
ncbi:hypothetical protein PFNF54_01190 [Plasmodium falciparum NF54]|uniref:Uncharacterized protein n=1 Tax=Plasmodium falciparum (isolate NF54) TaxID=5843 RepID=W7JZJ8_PLAFO|nr:hypothetical protein PFNF54_01190 [Plasmodium falciparum NF54]